MYAATEKGREERQRQQAVWKQFVATVDGFYGGEQE
jgi:DNA-binding PadR family transcriptional regulator